MHPLPPHRLGTRVRAGAHGTVGTKSANDACVPEPEHVPAAAVVSHAKPVEMRLLLVPEQLAVIATAVAALLPAGGATSAELWPEWMNVETAARYLDCTAERIRKLVERRQIPYYQEGPRCRVFFHRPELDQWMTGFRRQPRQRGAWFKSSGEIE